MWKSLSILLFVSCVAVQANVNVTINTQTGQDVSSCGPPSSPCKTLQFAFSNAINQTTAGSYNATTIVAQVEGTINGENVALHPLNSAIQSAISLSVAPLLPGGRVSVTASTFDISYPAKFENMDMKSSTLISQQTTLYNATMVDSQLNAQPNGSTYTTLNIYGSQLQDTKVDFLAAPKSKYLGNMAIDRSTFINSPLRTYAASITDSIFLNATTTAITINILVLTGCELAYNSGDKGGAIYASSLNTKECTFRANKATSGGAIFFDGDYDYINILFLQNSLLTDNTATFGGAVYFANNNNLSTASISLDGSNFTTNSAELGGAIMVTRGSTVITAWTADCNFVANTAIKGGAVYTNTTYFSVIGARSQSNTAIEGAAFYSVNAAQFTVKRASFGPAGDPYPNPSIIKLVNTTVTAEDWTNVEFASGITLDAAIDCNLCSNWLCPTTSDQPCNSSTSDCNIGSGCIQLGSTAICTSGSNFGCQSNAHCASVTQKIPKCECPVKKCSNGNKMSIISAAFLICGVILFLL